MTILDIVTYPDKSLAQPSEKITDIDETLKTLIEDMADTMFEAPGAGLAAVQVGVSKQLIVINTTEEGQENSYMALINPEIVEADGEFISEDEGCLSVPEFRATVKRFNRVKVTALDVDGNPMELNEEGFPAVVLQHEIDHLKGVLFINRISALKREMYKRKVKKWMKGR
ncbi:peptide deformylase [Desulfoluna butyratoxydans]|uniref:Peptide deformylase n=1 Tax=Desulfoluna butyratoxydans TaxID=231438 RepID=A0A4U8YS36_9BACT|nr:peptide deformylase [Desulfoluna butyratoxydans]VFQ47195.1 peptide deformylase [Desulfoluna butyratoxydans]